jgi:hypothetical protein
VARTINRCPQCGERVSQFAAGCALCGADLTAARQELERRREARPSVARLERPSWFPEISGADAVLGLVLVVAAFAAPVIGGPIAAVFAYFAHQKGDLVQRNIALVAVGVALLVIVLVEFVPGSWSLLLPWVNLSSPIPAN